ncbi:UAA transporter [Polychaeton citri CBS 116435]|uniref:UAA transporter n=1 Tax=Polychaeton citri CBS 116435 TaxID=1314669 RepID=A0A9P4QEG7_9PEZI|nr:UAA transporter [Polychaeton citri CBS 116435]
MLFEFSIIGLIFGGCCSNVYALEKLLKVGSDSGLLVTFSQFALTALVAYPTQFSSTSFPVKRSAIPFRDWLWIACLHGSINLLNNWAFAFNISVPVHIVLRSFGSVTTMVASYLRGKRFSALQVTSVAILTAGVITSALADAERKGKSLSLESEGDSSEFSQGLAILAVAQVLSAYMGVYVQETYSQYGGDWRGNLFYSHFLSLPMFIPISSQLWSQWDRLQDTAYPDGLCFRNIVTEHTIYSERTFPDWIPLGACQFFEGQSEGTWFLVMNSLTQLLCIAGVNLLSAKSTSLTVTIVLNIRKLVSFILSTILFGHQLSNKMILGSTLVFGAGALYGYETSWRTPRREKTKTKTKTVQANGLAEKGKKTP